MGGDAGLNVVMLKLLIFIASLLIPAALMAAEDVNKQIDKTPKEQPVLTDKQGGSKQGKPAAEALDPVRFEFVRTNLISTFYHEMAHALIDMMELPVLGQEEDAADVFSVLMVERLFDKEEAVSINEGAARGFEVDAVQARGRGREWDWADEHGPDMQRYYNIVCLTYGSDPEKRKKFATDMGLPTERAEICKDEFELAKRSWLPIIKRIEAGKSNETVSFRQTARTPLQLRAAMVIENEIKTVNDRFHLPKRLRVLVKRCDRDSDFYAFYSSSRRKITVCTNYIDQLYRNAPK